MDNIITTFDFWYFDPYIDLHKVIKIPRKLKEYEIADWCYEEAINIACNDSDNYSDKEFNFLLKDMKYFYKNISYQEAPNEETL